jgi:hypothetical protein
MQDVEASGSELPGSPDTARLHPQDTRNPRNHRLTTTTAPGELCRCPGRTPSVPCGNWQKIGYDYCLDCLPFLHVRENDTPYVPETYLHDHLHPLEGL